MAHDDTRDPAAHAYRLFNALKTGRPSRLPAVHEALSASPRTVDHVHLRRLIVDALTGEFQPGPGEPAAAQSVRCFMLGTLGRVADDDADALRLLRKHVTEDEPYEWARYWALEGLIAGRYADLQNLARELLNSEREHLVRMLAIAVLAEAGDKDSDEEIMANIRALASGDKRTPEAWAMLRALRSVYLPSTVSGLCQILASSKEPDTVFDVIAALGRVGGTPHDAERVALSLSDLLKRYRDVPWMHAARIKALELLGRLRVAETESTMFKELKDGDPGTVRSAARALEELLGTDRATERVVEAALEAPHDLTTYVEGLRSMRNAAAVADKLEATMSEGHGDQHDIARKLLREIGGSAAFQKLRARTRASRKYLQILENAEGQLRQMFETSIREARTGFKIAMGMDLAVFAFGLLLLAVSAGLAIANDGLGSWAIGASGATGLAGVLYGTFVARPRRQVRQAVDHLMHLNLVFLGYLRQLHQTDQAYTRRLLDDERLQAHEVREFTEMVEATMANAVQRLIPPPRRRPRDTERQALAHA